MSREILVFAEFSAATGTTLFLGKVGDSGFLAIDSLILRLRAIHERSGSLVAPASRTFPLFLGVPVSFNAGKSSVILTFSSALSKGAVTL